MNTLTAAKLNEQIVRMRKIVEKARVRLSRHLIRQIRKLKMFDSEKKQRKAKRLMDELKACKRIQRDDVSKFALLNLKTLSQLNIRGDTLPQQRILYKLSVEKIICENVNAFRSQYPEWHMEIPYILQRLGLQYQKKKKKNLLLQSEAAEEQKNVENFASSSSKSASEITALVNKKIKSALSKKGKLLMKKRKQEKANMPILITPIKDLPKPPVVNILKGSAVIQKIDLSSADSEYVELAPSIGDSIPVIPQCEGTFPASLDKNADCATNSEIGGEQDLNLKNKKIEAICEESKKFIKNGKILVEKKNSHFDNKCVNKKGQQNESAKPGLDSTDETYDNLDNLHPSWAAKKRQKLLMKNLSNIKPKKIVFDDGD